ncbi:MAG TPA: hypothetical protein VNG71_06465 [Pyrinomonadaceae bacterium]|nr:hypothetical protein [Pyrinomonadaceae bacterium]
MSILRFFPLLLLFVVFSGSSVTTALAPATKKCGTERWAVKTLSDSGGKKVNLKPEYWSIGDLVRLKNPIRKGGRPPDTRLSPMEYRTFLVQGYVIGYKLESDGDFHVIIADKTDRTQTMIVEVPDPQCDGASSSGLADKYQSARGQLIRLVGSPRMGLARPNWDVLVNVIGVGFFDTLKGQAGAAPNGFELHPVISLDVP